MQCHNGHTLCSTCKTRVQNQCPTCRKELGDGKTPLEASRIAIGGSGTIMCIPNVCSWGISKSCVDACYIFLCQMYTKLSSILLLYWTPYSLKIDNFPWRLNQHCDRFEKIPAWYLRKFRLVICCMQQITSWNLVCDRFPIAAFVKCIAMFVDRHLPSGLGKKKKKRLWSWLRVSGSLYMFSYSLVRIGFALTLFIYFYYYFLVFCVFVIERDVIISNDAGGGWGFNVIIWKRIDRKNGELVEVSIWETE